MYDASNATTEKYCYSEDVENLNQVSNQGFCGEMAAKENIGFYINVEFPIHYEDMEYCFDFPVSWSLGGVSKS